MCIVFWVLFYLIVTGVITFFFCHMQMKVGVNEYDGLCPPVICGIFWIIAGMPYAGYIFALYYNKYPEKAPWNKANKSKNGLENRR